MAAHDPHYRAEHTWMLDKDVKIWPEIPADL